MTTVEKPWGREIIWAKTQFYVGKILVVNDGQRLSLQYHKNKTETCFLSPTTAGALTTTETTTVGEVTKPVLRALSATTAIFVGMRGAVIS